MPPIHVAKTRIDGNDSRRSKADFKLELTTTAMMNGHIEIRLKDGYG